VSGPAHRLDEQAPVHGPIPAQAGIGLRFPHHRQVIETRPAVAWFEVHTENYFGGGTSLECLEQIRNHYPIALHGVGLSLGSAGALDPKHLRRIRELAQRIEPALISEHLSFSLIDGLFLPDLLPLPMTEEALATMSEHVLQVQEALGRQILVENPSSYLRYRHSIIPEWEFLAALAERTGCALLCDVNNIYVCASNHGWDADTYLSALPVKAVREIHVAGHSERTLSGGRRILIDDHGSEVCEAVWALYRKAIARFGAVPTLIEWDNNIPAFEVLEAQAARAGRHLAGNALHAAA
jgi:uncharacterized protein (UPF0276 family)